MERFPTIVNLLLANNDVGVFGDRASSWCEMLLYIDVLVVDYILLSCEVFLSNTESIFSRIITDTCF